MLSTQQARSVRESILPLPLPYSPLSFLQPYLIRADGRVMNYSGLSRTEGSPKAKTVTLGGTRVEWDSANSLLCGATLRHRFLLTLGPRVPQHSKLG